MKPVKLHMKNIGPYLDETVDFSKLDNMFLIKGDTGSGKTFIFDAITYALYGKLCGNRANHENDFKSRYAKETDDSFVEFTFEASGKKYFIHRTVPFYYKNRNGKETKKTKEVSFSEIKNDKKENFFGKLEEIDKKIQQIIGLNDKEFAQIILLPQGKFAEFLHKNSKDRAETLKTLFPVEFYTNITERIKKKCDDANYKLNLLEEQIKSTKSEFDFSNAKEFIKKNEDEILDLQKKEKDFQKKITEIATSIANLNHNLKESCEFEENQKKFVELQSQKEEFNLLNEKIERAEKSLHLKEFITTKENAEENKKSTLEKFENAKIEKENNQKNFDNLELKKNEMKKLEEKNQQDSGAFQVLSKKIEDAKDLPDLLKKEKDFAINIEENKQKQKVLNEKLEQENKNLENKEILEITNEVNENLKNLTESKNLLEDEIENSKKRDKILKEKSENENELQQKNEELKIEEEKLNRTEKTIEELEKKSEEQKLKNQAYSVSVLLKPNFPCPVCGSKNHPSPIEKPSGILDYTEQIKTNKANLESIQKLILNFQKEISSLTQKNQNFEENLKEIKTQSKIENLEVELKNLSEKIINLENKQKYIKICAENISKYKTNLEEIKEKSSEQEKEYLSVKTKRQTLEENLGESLESALKKQDDLKNELSENTKKYENWENDYNSTKTALEKSKTKFEECQKSLEDAENKFLIAEKNLLKKIEQSDFKDEIEVKNAFLENEEIENSRKSYNEYKTNLKSLGDVVKIGKDKNLKSSKEISLELENEKNHEVETTQKMEEVRNLLDAKKNENARFKNNFEKFEKIKQEYDELEKEIAPLQLLNNDLSGKNPQKMKFETWALGMYFEQVVNFASQRFFEISDGRFSFELKNEKSSGNSHSGLDLRVFDSHSGKYSDSAELSGGETFEASISLALALTDVVQNSSGGIQLDSLFIDEGFGTLDPETLEKAMLVLSELGETKMIGMISHVSEMEEFPDIKSCIKVNKTNQNSTIEIV